MSASQDPWVKVRAIKGGQLVNCDLCGKHFKRSFFADNTNYAEALRLAIAYASTHKLSDAHLAALDVFHHAPAPAVSHEEKVLNEIFGKPPESERSRRRFAARQAAQRVLRRNA